MDWLVKRRLFCLVKKERVFLEMGCIDRKSVFAIAECSLGLSEIFLDVFRKSEFYPHLEIEFGIGWIPEVVPIVQLSSKMVSGERIW